MAQRLSRFVPSRKAPPPQQPQVRPRKHLTNSEARIAELSKSVRQPNANVGNNNKKQRRQDDFTTTAKPQTIIESHVTTNNAGGPLGFLRSHVLRRTTTNVLALKDSLLNFAWKHQFETEVTSLACIGSIIHECSSLQVFMFGLATLTLSNIVWRLIDQYQQNVVVEDNEIESKKKVKKVVEDSDGRRSTSVSVRILRQSAAARASSRRRTQSTLRESYVATTGGGGGGDGGADVTQQQQAEEKVDGPIQIITYKQARRWVDAHLSQFNAAIEHALGLFVAFDVFQAIRSYAAMKILNSFFFKQEFSSLFVVGNLSMLVLPRLYHYYKPMLMWLAAVFGREFKRALLLVWKLLLGYNNMLYDAEQKQQQVRRNGRLGRAVHFRREVKSRKVVVA